MVGILIVAILAAVLIPLMQGRIDRAKWSEANAAAGTIVTAARAFIAEKGPTYAGYGAVLTGDVTNWGDELGINVNDLDGRYFLNTSYSISSFDLTAGTVAVSITPVAGPQGAPAGTAVLALTGAFTITP